MATVNGCNEPAQKTVLPSSKKLVTIQPSQMLRLCWEWAWKNKNWLKIWCLLTSSLVVAGLTVALIVGVSMKLYLDYQVSRATRNLERLGKEFEDWDRKNRGK
jgi:uncharacterized protein (DUF2062 family)